MERIGASRRLAAAILDGVFTLVLIVIGVVIYATFGGANLAMEAQRVLGRPVSWNTVTSEATWEQYERRVEQMANDMETMIDKQFTDEQADFIARTVLGAMEERFRPEDLTIDYFLDLDKDDLDQLVDEGFDAVIAAGRSDIPADKVNALRAEMKAALDEFGIGTIVPRAIQFAIWLMFIPILMTLLYALIEGIFGRSPGKLITGIAIRREDGERAYASSYLLRYAAKYAPYLLMVLALLLRSPGVAVAAAISWVVVGIGMLVMLGPDKRAVYDYIAGTAVFTIRRGGESDE